MEKILVITPMPNGRAKAEAKIQKIVKKHKNWEILPSLKVNINIKVRVKGKKELNALKKELEKIDEVQAVDDLTPF